MLEILECYRKNCKWNKWGIVSQYHCTKTIPVINATGKCISFEKTAKGVENAEKQAIIQRQKMAITEIYNRRTNDNRNS